MRIGVLGTGVVGRTIASKLAELGHDVYLGSRGENNEAAAEWLEERGGAGRAGTFASAAAHGEMLFNCTSGVGSLDAVGAAEEENLPGKVLVDVSNPLDFSQGFPPSLTVPSTDSLAEQIQRAHPDLRVVKALNTVTAALMVDPGAVEGDHMLPICGNDEAAKQEVRALLNAFGWSDEQIVDLGDLSAARGQEAYLLLWVRLLGAIGSPVFNVAIRR
jgi:predicted dinucleotide-binding enzyme